MVLKEFNNYINYYIEHIEYMIEQMPDKHNIVALSQKQHLKRRLDIFKVSVDATEQCDLDCNNTADEPEDTEEDYFNCGRWGEPNNKCRPCQKRDGFHKNWIPEGATEFYIQYTPVPNELSFLKIEQHNEFILCDKLQDKEDYLNSLHKNHHYKLYNIPGDNIRVVNYKGE